MITQQEQQYVQHTKHEQQTPVTVGVASTAGMTSAHLNAYGSVSKLSKEQSAWEMTMSTRYYQKLKRELISLKYEEYHKINFRAIT